MAVTLTLRLAGTVDAFDRETLRSNLLTLTAANSAAADSVEITSVVAGSILVTARMIFSSPSNALAIERVFTSSLPELLTVSLGLTVEGVEGVGCEGCRTSLFGAPPPQPPVVVDGTQDLRRHHSEEAAGCSASADGSAATCHVAYIAPILGGCGLVLFVCGGLLALRFCARRRQAGGAGLDLSDAIGEKLAITHRVLPHSRGFGSSSASSASMNGVRPLTRSFRGSSLGGGAGRARVIDLQGALVEMEPGRGVKPPPTPSPTHKPLPVTQVL